MTAPVTIGDFVARAIDSADVHASPGLIASTAARALVDHGDTIMLVQAVREALLPRVRKAYGERPAATGDPKALPATRSQPQSGIPDSPRVTHPDRRVPPAAAPAPCPRPTTGRWSAVRALQADGALFGQHVITESGPKPLGECTYDDMKTLSQLAASNALDASQVARQYLAVLTLMREHDATEVRDLDQDHVRNAITSEAARA